MTGWYIPDLTSFAPGYVLDARYELLRTLGSGGMGTVYRARDRVFERDVALKLLRFQAPDAMEAFRREFVLLSGSTHPHLARCFDFACGTVNGERAYYFTSELILGPSLLELDRERLRASGLSALTHAVQALAWLHQSRLLHGDFKPDNVLFAGDRGVLIDLSCARHLDAAPAVMSGTPGFVAPEILQGAPVDARADVYGVGRTLQVLADRLSGELPGAILQLAARATRADPAERPIDAVEVLDVLQHTLGTKTRAASLPPIGAPRELIGRDAPWRRVLAILEQFVARRHGPRIIWLWGRPGIGKTRLFRELTWWAEQRVTVSEGNVHGTEPLHGLLGRALPGAQRAATVDAALSLRDALAAASRRSVLAIDDVDRLPHTDAELLHALLRSTTSEDACLWLLCSSAPPPAKTPVWLVQELEPLDEASVRSWIAPYVSAVPAERVAAWTGGVPQALHALCSELARGEIREAALFVDRPSEGRAPWWEARIQALDSDCQRALVLLSLLEAEQTPARLARLAVTPRVLMELESWGFVRWEGDRARLASTRDARELRAACDRVRPQELAAHAADTLRDELSGALPRGERESLLATVTQLDVHAGRLDSAEAALAGAAPGGCTWAPEAWSRAARALCAVRPSVENWERRALVEEARGDLPGALAAIARGLRLRPAPPQQAALWCRAALCAEKSGHVRRALRLLERGERLVQSGPMCALAALVGARCALREGRYGDAAAIATDVLNGPVAVDSASQLHEVAALAFGYLGAPDQAAAHLERALAVHGSDVPPRARVRLASYRALQAFRAGDAQLASRHFAEALETAERAALGDLIATAALNAGTAAHQLGDWGAALTCYERGLRAAAAYGKSRTEATLRFNLAKLFSDVGALERAEQHLAGLERHQRDGGLRELEAAVLGLRAEMASGASNFDDARELLARACALLAASGQTRELIEAELQDADILLRAGQLTEAAQVLQASEPRIAPLGARDLELRHALLAATLALKTEQSARALEHLERAARCDEASGQLALRAELHVRMAEVYEHTGATHLAEQARQTARAAWERVALKLPKELRDVFYRHPHRRLPAGRAAPEHDPGESSLLRVLAINKRLSSTLDVEEILELAMDSAIELTGAERGFLILPRAGSARSKRGLQVAVARNLDRERLGKSHYKFSQDIAQRVVATGEPLLSIDASSDPRFESSVSIHAMRLRSVVCVPIRAHERVLGALYLDNRFQHGRFRDADLIVLSAFADQVAIALHNGRLWAELQQRTAELEREQARVRELVATQAKQIDELTDELERERQHPGTAQEIGGIVGTSPAIGRVRGLIRRVAKMALPVLIQGESGTGKELVARAIHELGAPGPAPFVAINCAALPHGLLESELFGHRKGAFTDAVRDHRGVFVAAKGGTLFLDEIGEIPLPLQAKLLRVIQEREVQPLGAEKCVRVDDVRLVFATNQQLAEEVKQGRFREDLFYRVGVVEITLPPLRERLEDVPALCEALLERIAQRHGEAARRLSHAALRRLLRYSWPGNVRQLENVLSRAVVLSENSEIMAQDIELPVMTPVAATARSRAELRQREAAAIRDALVKTNYNVCEVSRALGIPRTSLYRKLRQYELWKPDP